MTQDLDRGKDGETTIQLYPATAGQTTFMWVVGILAVWVLFNLFACCCCRHVTKYTCCLKLCCSDNNLPASIVDPNVVSVKKVVKKKYPTKIPERAIPSSRKETTPEPDTTTDAAPKVMHSPYQALAATSDATLQAKPADAPAAAAASSTEVEEVEPLLIPEPMLIAPMEFVIEPLEVEPLSDDEITLKSIVVDGQELIKPEPEKCVNDHCLMFPCDDRPTLSTQSTMASGPSVMAVGTCESEGDVSSEVGQPLRLPKRGGDSSEEEFSAVPVSIHENEASISAAVNDVSRDGKTDDSVQISIHENDASISAAVYDVSRNDTESSTVEAPSPDFEVEISEHMNEASISAACYEGRDEL